MKKKFFIIGFLLIFLILGVTYAWFRWSSANNTNVTFTIDGATVTYNAGPDISNVLLIPVSSKEKGVTDNTAVYKEITASSNSSMYLTLNLDLVTFPSGLADASLVWEIYKGTTKIGHGNFNGKAQGDSITLFTNQEINSTQSLYKLYIWIDGLQDNPSTMMNQSFVFHLNASATDQVPVVSDLPDFILNSNAPLDSVNSTYVAGYYERYTVSNEDKENFITFLIDYYGISREDAEEEVENDSLRRSFDNVELYNQYYDSDIEAVGVNLTSGINFNKSASDTNGKGLYIRGGTENNVNPIYYYRGDVDNNNVLFADLCWKIFRTTDTGGLKLIYNGIPSNGTCNNTGSYTILTDSFRNRYKNNFPFNFNNSLMGNIKDEIAMVGYMYGQLCYEWNSEQNYYEKSETCPTYLETHSNINDSTIKTQLDSWYQSNMTSYTSMLEKVVFCNDRSLYSGNGITGDFNDDQTRFGAFGRIGEGNENVFGSGPILSCPNESRDLFSTSDASIGNKMLTYPVGLITADELILVGFDQNFYVSSTYLSNSGFWTGTPALYGWGDGYGTMNYYAYDGELTYSEIDEGEGYRPVIILAPGYSVSSGTGVVNSPYVIE